MNEPARTQDITLCLIGSEQHKAKPGLSDDSGFWLRVKAEDASPFLTAYPRTRFGSSNFCIGCEDIARMRSALSDTTWGGPFSFAMVYEPMRA